ncbi:MAG TPA: ABC transporter permease subunit, partial [Nocardioides sp.]|nr:ABC transporter permease subunit [Nocardioides sp.]
LPDLVSATSASVSLAVTAGLVATLAALPIAWLSVRHRGRLTTALERGTYVASAMPGIVVALALVTVSIRLVPDLYQTVLVLVAGYVVLFLPRAVVSIRPTLELAPPVLEDVARSLGCSRSAASLRVTLPLIVPGLAAGFALVSLAVSTELTATLLLAPTGTSTLSTEFWSKASSVAYGAAAPYALVLILLSVPATWLLSRVTVGAR